jgi:hypothetical protein
MILMGSQSSCPRRRASSFSAFSSWISAFAGMTPPFALPQHLSNKGLSLSLSLSACLLLVSCQEQTPQTGHRVIAEEVRTLLNKAYAGADYLTYRDELHKLEAIVAQEQKNTPIPLQPKTEEILGYLRTAGSILRWQAEQPPLSSSSANDPFVKGWIERYPFLNAAIGAHTPNVFDVQTALTLLWDKTNAVLREFQIKRGS